LCEGLGSSKRQHSCHARRDTFRHQPRPLGLTLGLMVNLTLGLRQTRRPNGEARCLRGSETPDTECRRNTTGKTRQTREMSEIRQLHTAS
jgi:hypothetical protein